MARQNDDDLDVLIEQAQKEASKSSALRAAPAKRRGMLWIWAGCVAIVAAFSVHSVWRGLAPPSTQQTTRDLEAAVDAARASIEQSRSQTGKLPETLPNASLAAVVSYEPGLSDYKLSATIMGVRVTLQPDGKMINETGVEK